ncbi:4Fe-4S dicluster domain-containing protein [Candidatus Woesearchaeota archaeon]|nr:4Fe-4S dicluster domain-containing protein [Candidatus Woesearchaeota archaeon]
MDTQFELKKRDLNEFLANIIQDSELIAPVKKEDKQVIFSQVVDPSSVSLSNLSLFPVKNYFFSKKEVILKFKNNKIIDTSESIVVKKRIFFGLRKCDINSIMHQDIVFLENDPDPFYKARREKSILIGVHCKEGDEYCFCNSFELGDYQDLMFYEKNKSFIIEAYTQEGLCFLNNYRRFLELVSGKLSEEDKLTKNSLNLKNTDIGPLYDKMEWETMAEKCLVCGACNHLCPNCHCFVIKDETDFSLKTGERVRIPASCMQRRFTRVAGDHVFRREKTARFKHRIYHQIKYFHDRHHVIFCTGCGRCIRGCPTKIDWVTKINEMSGEQ